MKPPSGNRSGGSGRPPSDRGSGGPNRPRQGGEGRSHSGGGGGGGGGGHHGGHRQDNRSWGSPNRNRPDRNRDDRNRDDRNRDGGNRDGGNRSGADRGQAARPDQQRPDRERAERSFGQRPDREQQRPDRERSDRPFGQRPDREQQRPDRERSGPRPQGPRAPDAPKGTVWLYGHHAVAAAMANPARRLRRLLLTDEAEATLAAKVPQPWPLAPEKVERSRIDNLLGRDIVHQGVALLADTLATPSLQSVLERTGPILVLDQVHDPRNIGAILRSAAAFGAAGVITQDRNAPEESGALAKAASGALETMPLLRAVNIARTLIALKAADVWCVGLDASGTTLKGAPFAGRRVALVLGAEGDGMRRLTRETCDEVAGLPIQGGVDSLNVSAAAAVALYEITRPA